MNTKEFPFLLGSNQADINSKSNKITKILPKSHIEEFQDAEINNYDLKNVKQKDKK